MKPNLESTKPMCRRAWNRHYGYASVLVQTEVVLSGTEAMPLKNQEITFLRGRGVLVVQPRDDLSRDGVGAYNLFPPEEGG